MSETQTDIAHDSGPLSAFPPARWMVLVSAALIGALYLGGLSARWEPMPDSALYLGLGRSLVNGEGYQFNGQPNNTVTPGLPWVLAGLQWAFGPAVSGERMFPANLLMVLCSLGALWLVYACIALWSDRRTALAATIATAASYTTFANAHNVLTDLPFMLLFWAMLYCCLRAMRGSWAWLVPAAVLSAAGIVLRAPGALLIGPLALGLVLDRAAAVRRVAAGATVLLPALGAGVFFLWLSRQVSAQTSAYIAGSVGGSSLPRHVGQLPRAIGWELPESLVELFTGQRGMLMLPIGLALMVLAAVGAAVLWKKGNRTVATILASYPILLTLLGGFESVRPRYLVPAFPLLVYACVEGLCAIVRTLQARRGGGNPAATLWAVNVLVAVVAAANLPKDFYQAVLVHYSDYYHRLRGAQHEDTMNMRELLGPGVSPGAGIALSDGNEKPLVWMTGKNVTVLWDQREEGRQPTPADADKIVKLLCERRDLKYVILHVSNRIEEKKRQAGVPDNAAFWDRLQPQVRAMEGAELIYPTAQQRSRGLGKSLQVYRRP